MGPQQETSQCQQVNGLAKFDMIANEEWTASESRILGATPAEATL